MLQRRGAIFVVFQSMKSLQIICFQVCLLLLAACGPKGPRVVQKGGFTLVYDTLDFDMSVVDPLPNLPLEFVGVVPLDDGYLCAFEQRHHYSHSCPSNLRYVLRVDRETGQAHIVDFPDRDEPYWTIQERDGVVYMSYPEWCDTMWRFIPEREAWEDATVERDIVYEDEDYRVYSRKMHFSRDHTWFLDKRTGEQYVFPAAAGQVLRLGGNFYFTDLARFRGLTDPKVGFLCDSLSDYASTLTVSRPMMPVSLRSRLREMKVFGSIYAFGEGDDGYRGCESSWPRPDTVFNASFKVQKSLCQIVTAPETTWITQVTSQGLKWIVDLGKRYDTHLIGRTRLFYKDDEANVGIIELGDTLRFHHLRY